MRYFSIALAVTVCQLAPPALADTQSRLSTEDFDLILRAAGFTPDLSTDDETHEPFASMAHGGYNFSARGNNCTAKGCTQIMFFANFELDREVNLSDYRALNSYNDKNYLGRAYAVEKDQKIGIDFVIDLSGGVSLNYIRKGAEAFPDLIDKFVDAYKSFNSDE